MTSFRFWYQTTTCASSPRSSTTCGTPWRAASAPAARPAGPPPTINISKGSAWPVGVTFHRVPDCHGGGSMPHEGEVVQGLGPSSCSLDAAHLAARTDPDL